MEIKCNYQGTLQFYSPTPPMTNLKSLQRSLTLTHANYYPTEGKREGKNYVLAKVEPHLTIKISAIMTIALEKELKLLL